MSKKAPNWKLLCWKFVSRSMRLSSFKKHNLSNAADIINREKKLIKEAYNEMKKAILDLDKEDGKI